MYGNLLVAIKSNKITQREIAKKLNISSQSMTMKVRGKRDFTAPEMFEIQRAFFPNMTLEELFEKK